MKTLIHKPQYFFFGMVPVFLLFSWWGIDKYVDLAFFTSFLYVKISHWSLLSALFVALIGINYSLVFWAKKPLIPFLSITHIMLQLLAAIGFMYSLMKIGNQLNEYSETNFHLVLSVSFVIFIASIITHLFNFFLSLFRKS